LESEGAMVRGQGTVQLFEDLMIKKFVILMKTHRSKKYNELQIEKKIYIYEENPMAYHNQMAKNQY